MAWRCLTKLQSCGGLKPNQSDSGLGIAKSNVRKPFTEARLSVVANESGGFGSFLSSFGRHG